MGRQPERPENCDLRSEELIPRCEDHGKLLRGRPPEPMQGRGESCEGLGEAEEGRRPNPSSFSDEELGRDGAWSLELLEGLDGGEILRRVEQESPDGTSFRRRRRSRVRERAMGQGLSSLSDAELLSLLLGTGTSRQSVAELAEGILSQLGGVVGLGGRNVRSLTRLKGIGPARACRIAAAVELGRRVMAGVRPERLEVHEPEDLRSLLLPIYRGCTREAFHVVLLNARNGVIDVQRVAEGTVDACILHPREVFRIAIEAEATGIVLAHNHPSGNPRPSCEDLNLTERFRRVARVLGMKLMDHVIVAGEEIVSIRALGFWDDPGDLPEDAMLDGDGFSLHEPKERPRLRERPGARRRVADETIEPWSRILAPHRALVRELRPKAPEGMSSSEPLPPRPRCLL